MKVQANSLSRQSWKSLPCEVYSAKNERIIVHKVSPITVSIGGSREEGNLAAISRSFAELIGRL